VCSIKIPIQPIPQKRHRNARRNGKTFQYDPSSKDKAHFKKLVSSLYSGDILMDPVSVSIIFGFSRPKSHYGSGKNSGKLKSGVETYVKRRPDIDNLLKFVFDSCNGLLWHDDSLICEVQTRKIYTETPFIEIEFWKTAGG
jgi:Holliday junction resolvase RusA-like endonuclease